MTLYENIKSGFKSPDFLSFTQDDILTEINVGSCFCTVKCSIKLDKKINKNLVQEADLNSNSALVGMYLLNNDELTIKSTLLIDCKPTDETLSEIIALLSSLLKAKKMMLEEIYHE